MDKDKLDLPVSGVVAEADGGKRLDAALAQFFPLLGLRARRRLWQWCRVLLDGREAGPGEYVRAGQRLELIPLDNSGDAQEQSWHEVKLVARTADYFSVYKPGGLASARISGGAGCSVEEFVLNNPNLFGLSGVAFLCNRLDTPTSGLLLWALSQEALERFRLLEGLGAVEKRYHALVRGLAPDELHLDFALDTAARAKTRVLAHPDSDKTRHTHACRMAQREYAGALASLLDVMIKRGARHQIRAHLAAAGFPIIGDALYGSLAEGGDIMHLHHYRIAFEGFLAEIPAPWANL